MTDMEKDVQALKKEMWGNGKPRECVVIRLDNIEKQNRSLGHWAKTTVTLVLGLIVATAWGRFTGTG